MSKGVSLVLPLFNEDRNTSEVTAAALDFFQKAGGPFEIILVDDGSTDGTPAIVDRLADRHPGVRVLHHPSNRGYGAALASGFREARLDTVVFMDADGQFDISEIGKLLVHAGSHDIVAGCRRSRRDPWFRVALGEIYTRAIGVIFRIRLRDLNCGFKAIRRSVLRQIRISTTGALVNAEIMIQARRLECSVKEVDVTHFPRTQGHQTGADLGVILKALWEARMLFAAPTAVSDPPGADAP